LWAISRLDFATWMIAFLTTVGLNITWGLTLSVLSVLFFNVLREQWPRFWQLHGGSDAHWRTSNETIIFRPCALYAGSHFFYFFS
jgi:hypothetical protein